MKRRTAGSFGRSREEKLTIRAFWKCLAANSILAVLTALSYLRPEWLQFALVGTTTVSCMITLIGLREAYAVWRNQ